MSVNVCVFKYDATSIEVARYNNQNTTPPFNWDAVYGYIFRINTRNYNCIPPDKTNTGSTKTYSLLGGSKSVETIVPTSYNGTFRLETGYVVVASKNLTALECETITTSDEDITIPKSIFLSGEPCYFFASSGYIGGKYRFLGWYSEEILVSQDNPFLQTITADRTLTAFFEQYKWSVTAQSSNTTVGDAYVGTSGTATTGLYENNKFATLRAVVKTAYQSTYKFKRWTLNGVEVSTDSTLQVATGQSDVLYVAVFIPKNYTLNVTPQNALQGAVEVYLAGVKQVTTTGLTVAGLSSVEVRTVPTFGYYLSAWHDGTSNVNSSLSYTFTMPEANLSLEARYAILPEALLVVTKKKGDGTEDPKDMGSLTLYHTVDNYVSASPVGELTLQASMFTISPDGLTKKQYRIVPTPASELFQFDGWYKTVLGSDVLITDDTVFNVDWTSLYIDVLDQTQINVIARFSKRTLCTIDPVASDSSVYTSGNAAKTAGCTCVVNTLPPDYDANSDGLHNSGDQWRSGQTITVEARQAIGWELRNWIVKKAVSPFTTLYSIAKGDVGFGQTFAFTLLENVQVVAVSSYTLPANQVQIQALLKSGQPLTSGTVEIHPCGDNYVEAENGSTANVDDGGECELTAIPANGYRFVGWRVATEGSSVISTNPVYSFTVSGNAVYYAEFEESDGEALKLFEGSDSNMTLRWASKTFLAPVPISMSSARVYADAYPVRIGVGMSDNPSHPAATANVLYTTVQNQNPFRLPMRRPRKSIVIEIEATDVVSEVSVATSMEDLKNA